ncbi:MAG: hypothetical protein M1818_003997 [Claussenomyces sp. TS43310]|nr:MAG: hypothetical protein M1818_003997 [Claussenomyces sp. TS43310]
MFSEYASRFLAQSQSRISNFVQPDSHEFSRNHADRYRSSNQRGLSRPYQQRQSLGNPYQPTASHVSNFPFASRLSAAPDAPLFHSALDDFREEDDEEERDREVADFYALQRSRRVFGADRLEESAETDEGSNLSAEDSKDDGGQAFGSRGRARGIKSSWNGRLRSPKDMAQIPTTVEEPEDVGRYRSTHDSESSYNNKGKMENVGLESTMASSEVPDDLAVEMPLEDSPPSFQQFRGARGIGPIKLDADLDHLDRRRALESTVGVTRPASIETVPPTVPVTAGDPPKHDRFWGSLFLICLASLFATFFLVFLHTSTPSKKVPLGDTIYTTLQASLHLFAVDTLVSVIVSLLWLALLRSFVRPLVYLIVVAVPIIMVSFSLYPLISSYKGATSDGSFQDRVMRWLSFVPAAMAILWVYTAYKGRHAFTRAIGILEFSSRILGANPSLLIAGFITLTAFICWTWMWLGMFTRVFLGGQLSSSGALFIIDASTWWLGVFFVIMYLWVASFISGVQRATTAATVSQWYFHRNAEPKPSSADIVSAAFTHAVTTIFGTIALSTLLALLIRLPFLLLPRRLMTVVSIFAYSFIPAPITTLMNPLSLSYAAIRSQPLQSSARALSQMLFLGPQAPTTTLTPPPFSSRGSTGPLLPYRLAKLLLHATRFIMAIALGFGGWVATARQLSIDTPSGVGLKGSAYAYVVGFIASFIGWGVLGAIEGVLSGIVDASIICWGIEKTAAGGGSYCLEAGYLFSQH